MRIYNEKTLTILISLNTSLDLPYLNIMALLCYTFYCFINTLLLYIIHTYFYNNGFKFQVNIRNTLNARCKVSPLTY